MNKMRFLIVGYGCAGKRHAAILRDMGHEVVSVDPDSAVGADYHTWFIFGPTASERLDFDGILDCTPPDVREGWAIPARYRFIEKPLGRSPPVPLLSVPMLGFNYRYAHGLSDFVTEVKNHTVYSVAIVGGQPLQDWHEEDYRDVRQRYRGVATDSLPHSLYVARWLLGELELVGSVVGKLSGLELNKEDVAAVLLRSWRGVPCYLLADYLRDPRAFWVEAVTSGGWMRWEFAAGDAREMYRRQMEVFCRVCEGNMAGGYPDLGDGLAVQELLDAITS